MNYETYFCWGKGNPALDLHLTVREHELLFEPNGNVEFSLSSFRSSSWIAGSLFEKLCDLNRFLLVGATEYVCWAIVEAARHQLDDSIPNRSKLISAHFLNAKDWEVAFGGNWRGFSHQNLKRAFSLLGFIESGTFEGNFIIDPQHRACGSTRFSLRKGNFP